MKQAVILAGGKGTRLAEHLKGLPKPLVDLAGIPLLERQIRHLAQFGIDDIVVLVNYAADTIARFFEQRKDLGVHVTLVDDGEPRGTAGAVLACLDRLADRFLVIYGDTLFNIDVARFVAHHRIAKADATLFLHPNDHPQDSDLVETNDDGHIVAFHPYPHPSGAYHTNLVNAAFYAMEKGALLAWSDFRTPSDFVRDLFPEMIKKNALLNGYRSFEYIKDLGTPARLAKVEQALRSGVLHRASLSVKQKAVFVDRDGTLNVKRGFIAAPEQLDLIPGVGEAIRKLNQHEFRVAVITNQPVVARGECTFEQLRHIHDKLETLLGYEGAFVDGLFLCPHHPDSGFAGEIKALKVDCDCRKPKTGLVDKAVEQLNIDRARSWYVGDTTRDIETAKRSGVGSILVRTGEAGRDRKYPAIPDFVRPNLKAAVELILELDGGTTVV